MSLSPPLKYHCFRTNGYLGIYLSWCRVPEQAKNVGRPIPHIDGVLKSVLLHANSEPSWFVLTSYHLEGLGVRASTARHTRGTALSGQSHAWSWPYDGLDLGRGALLCNAVTDKSLFARRDALFFEGPDKCVTGSDWGAATLHDVVAVNTWSRFPSHNGKHLALSPIPHEANDL